jgi:hypothetical protein
MPFEVSGWGYYIVCIPKEIAMNWVFETYSNVYSTAMMHDVKTAKQPKKSRKLRAVFARLTGRA